MNIQHRLLHGNPRTRLIGLSLGLMAVLIASSALFVYHALAAGTTYYVATTGSDSNNGTSLSTAFQTVQKCASVAVAGDACLIAGGTYHETISPANSGTSSAPITFQPYNGQSVTIDGADPITGWTQYAGNIYVANVTLPVSNEATTSTTTIPANQVFVDGQMLNEVRYPYMSSLNLSHPTTATAATGSSSFTITDPNMPNLDWTGAVVHWLISPSWVSQTGVVTSYSNSSGTPTINFNGSTISEAAGVGANYYLIGGNNGLQALTNKGQWWYDWTNHKLYMWTPGGDNPANHTIEGRQRRNAFDLSGRSYITVQGLNLFAGSVLTSTTSSYDTLNSLNIQYPTHYLIMNGDPEDTAGFGDYTAHTSDSGIIFKGTNETLENSIIAYSSGNGIVLLGNNLLVTNNLIHDTDYSASYNAPVKISAFATNETGSAVITHNTIYNAARDGLNWEFGVTYSVKDQISYNNIYQYGLQNSDLGAIYVCCNQNGAGTSIDHNWTHDSGAIFGTGPYIDNGSNNFLIHHNVVWNTHYRGITLNASTSPTDTVNNLVYNNTLGPGLTYSIGGQSQSADGTKIINNIYSYGSTAIETLGSGATIANNLMPLATSTLFADTTNNDYHLKPNAPAIDQGQVITGITDGYVGAAPDIGAYEWNGTDWVPGCNISGCGTNLALNGGLESGTLDSWCTGPYYCGSVGVTFPGVHAGSYAGQVTGVGNWLQQVVTGLAPNTRYNLTAFGEVDTSGDQLWIGAGNFAGSGTDTHQVVTSTTYSPVSLNFTTGASTTSATIYLYKSSGAGSGYGDDFILAQNLLVNPGFETGTTSGWCVGGNAYCANNSVTTTAPHSGTYNGQVTGAGGQMDQYVSGLAPNTTYTLTAWGAVATAGEQLQLGAQNFQVNGTGTFQAVTSTTYTPISTTFTTDTTTSARISMWKANGAGNGYADDFVLTAASQNLLTNPGFEAGSLTGWCNTGATCTGDALVTNLAHTGTYALQLSGPNSWAEELVAGLQPNTTYTFTTWARVGTTGDAVQIGVKSFGGTETYKSIGNTTYTQASVTFTTGATNTSAIIYLWKPANAGNAWGDDSIVVPA